LVTVGSQDAICKSFETMIEPGDAVVVEEFIFAGILGVINPYKPEYIIVHADSDGMCPVR
jgi:kynurenine/2-aminoadipate aminotransferase